MKALVLRDCNRFEHADVHDVAAPRNATATDDTMESR